VAVATQLTFATDATDRDRLIAELTGELHQLEHFDFVADDVSSSPGSPPRVAVPFEANQGKASALHRTKKLEHLDISHDLAAALELPSLANDLLSPGLSDVLSIADTVCADFGAPTQVDETSSCSSRSDSISPMSDSDSSASFRRSCSPAGDASPASPRLGDALPWREKATMPSSNQFKTDAQQQIDQREHDAIEASLGGRHAYKTLLPQLAIPQRLTADVTIVASPMKKLRTPTGSVPRGVLPTNSSTRSAATGTEEPGALFSQISSSSSPLARPTSSEPIDEFITLLGFDDLFDDLPLPSSTSPSASEVARPTPICS